ncbi:DUF2577 family protein [Paenibacillus sp. CN-4]|uniref:DUF2577 family protein n=1 Tax=Paenibacillus nanchangensis TaxID=3348343 RepID=UPI00397D651B
MERIEGSGASQLVQLIRKIGHNTDVSIELATVTSAPPELKIKVDHMNVELEKDDLIVVQSLTKHKRTVTLISEGGASGEAGNMTSSATGTVSGNPAELQLKGLTFSSADFTAKEAELEFLDELKKDDRVLVAGIQQGQMYVILDRVVKD